MSLDQIISQIIRSFWTLLFTAIPFFVRRDSAHVSGAFVCSSCSICFFERSVYLPSSACWRYVTIKMFIVKIFTASLVVSLMGVVVIARPNFLFGESVHHQEPDAHYSASDRFRAVGYGHLFFLP